MPIPDDIQRELTSLRSAVEGLQRVNSSQTAQIVDLQKQVAALQQRSTQGVVEAIDRQTELLRPLALVGQQFLDAKAGAGGVRN